MNRCNQAFKIILILLLFRSQANAQSSSDVLAGFNRLENCGSLLYLAAHPDDENNRLLAYLGKGLFLRTAYLALNRGEGGQNLIGNEQGDALGLIRSRELLGARSADGALQFFTRAYDFGYSRSPKETLQFWQKDSVLSDVVWVIRRFRPDIIVNRFPTTGEGGHGHHTASAILSLEAIQAANDPTRFPEQLKYVKPWKVKRVFWNTYNFGGINTQSEDQVKLDVGGYSSILGKSYGEIAAESRSFHKSQGFGTGARRGSQLEYLRQLGGDPVKDDIFSGIDQSWNRIQGGIDASTLIKEASQKLDSRKPWLVLPILCKAWQSMDQIIDPFWKELKRDELKQLIQSCAGLWFSAEASKADYAAGEEIPVIISAISRNVPKVVVTAITYNDKQVKVQNELKLNISSENPITFVSDSTMISQPYWLKRAHDHNSYSITETGLQRGMPVSINKAVVGLTVSIEGVLLSFEIPILHKTIDPAKGEHTVAIRILPPLTLNFFPAEIIWSRSKSIPAHLELNANADSVSTTILFHLPQGIEIQPKSIPFHLKKGEKKKFDLKISAPLRFLTEKPSQNTVLGFNIDAYTTINGQVCNRAIHELEYDHTGKLTWFTPANLHVIPIQITVPSRKIAYIEGAGDQIPGVLSQLGFEVHFLSDEDLVSADLNQYGTIISGVRAYNVRKILARTNQRLLDYVKKGGNFIVQYNNPNALQVKSLGPYPFSLSTNRITDENALVGMLIPGSALLNFPNKISASDFDGWVQERGLYYPANQDSHYQAILSMQEEGTPELKTSILYVPYYKGNYIYTSLAFFRQLPAGIPGPIRLFVNMICTPGHGK